MAIYYVSPYGSASGVTGLGPDPTNPTNKPFLTLAQAIGTGGPAVAGDTVYIAPGVYRQSSSLILGVTGSSGNPITISGDPGNAQGFKDGSGNLLSAGEIRVTNYATNDTTLPTFYTTLNIGSKSYLNFSNIWFIGGTTTAGFVIYISAGHDITFTQCMIQQGPTANSGQSTITVGNASTQPALNLTFDRCIVMAAGNIGVLLTLAKTTSGTSDYNANVLIQNCLFVGGSTHVQVNSTGTGTYLGGGVTVMNCTMLWPSSYSVYASDSGVSIAYPINVYNCIIIKPGTSLSATTSGQLIEDYNMLSGRTNVTAGAHSTSDGSNCPMLDFGQWMLWGQQPRAIATPTVGSPQLGFGNGGTPPTYDWLSRNRPEGGGSLSNAIGYTERHDTAVQETVTTQAGGVGIRIGGPGSHEFQIPVDATTTTISVMCNYDANHGTTTPPQAILVAAPELGVASQTVTAPAVVGQWSTLTFGTITPTARGVVRVFLTARPAAANGNAYFDTFAVS